MKRLVYPRVDLFLILAGFLFGWGIARLIPILAAGWPPLFRFRHLFNALIPIWLWGSVLVISGIILVLWAVRTRFLHASDKTIDRGHHLIDELEREDSLRDKTDSLKPAPVESLDPPHLLLNQSRVRNPRIVAIGGGTGMPQLLRGLRAYTESITAIVTVADDGGSSGRLRELGMLPPGDFRNNIAALSEAEDLLTRLFQYRFPRTISEHGINDHSGLGGHSFGNLFIATMAAVTGSFEAGLVESSRVLAVRGRVLPSTLEHVILCAEIRRALPESMKLLESDEPATEPMKEEWCLVEGESRIPYAGGKIERVFLKPENARAYPEAIQAILQADLIVAGPGSFFTSVIPNLLVPAVKDAIISSPAPSIYLCNVATQPGETDFYTVSDHMKQLWRHAGRAFTNVLANDTYDIGSAPYPGSQWVKLPAAAGHGDVVRETLEGMPIEYRLFTGELADRERPSRHDPKKLASRLMEIFAELQGGKRCDNH